MRDLVEAALMAARARAVNAMSATPTGERSRQAREASDLAR